MHKVKMSLLLGAAMFVAVGSPSHAATLSGTVTSAKEGAMEGVLVTAKKDGSNIAVTVVSDDKGRYAFPDGRLQPGHYSLKVRAIGYVLDGPRAVDVGAAASAGPVGLVVDSTSPVVVSARTTSTSRADLSMWPGVPVLAGVQPIPKLGSR